MPKRKQKVYSRPKKPYDKQRIIEEAILVKKYGLKNKKEIWKAEKYIDNLRNNAKKLITASEEEKNAFTERQKSKGFNIEKFSDVLSLEKEDRLKRRLQSLVVKKELAKTPNQARQFVVHKKIAIGEDIINVPSHLTTLDEESKINLILVAKSKNQKILEFYPTLKCGVC